MTAVRIAQTQSFTVGSARQIVGSRRYAELGRKEVSGLGLEVGGSRLRRQDCRRVSGSSQCSTGEPADEASVARASSDRADRHELHHHLAYGGAK